MNAEANWSPPQDDDGNIVEEIDGDIALPAYGRM